MVKNGDRKDKVTNGEKEKASLKRKRCVANGDGEKYEASFYETKVPAKILRPAPDKRVFSDYFLASKNKYKARITKFVRTAQLGGEVAETAIQAGMGQVEKNDQDRLRSLASKSRFSFKRDGIVAMSQVLDLFCQGLFHEIVRRAKERAEKSTALKGKKKGTNSKEKNNKKDELPPSFILGTDDVQDALQALGWGSINVTRDQQ